MKEEKVEVKKEVEKTVFTSSVGSPYYVPISYQYDEKVKCMVPVFGKPLNRYEMIQASKPSCDINYIVQRALAGDQSVLHVRQESYMDVSDVPDNLNDLHGMQKDAISSFDSLDPKVKLLFGNDVDKFIAAVNDGSYQEIIKNGLAQQKVEQVEIKKSEESK